MSAVGACERSCWDVRWGSLWGREACEGCAEGITVSACECCHWDLRWSSPRGHEAHEWCADMGAVSACERSR
eukprot:4542616-Pyramimonas_sp.AAC.1